MDYIDAILDAVVVLRALLLRSFEGAVKVLSLSEFCEHTFNEEHVILRKELRAADGLCRVRDAFCQKGCTQIIVVIKREKATDDARDWFPSRPVRSSSGDISVLCQDF